MKINKQSSVYTVVYITIVVVLVGVALALTSTSLKPLRLANADEDKMRQILASIRLLDLDRGEITHAFDHYVKGQYFVDNDGGLVTGDAFGADVARDVKAAPDKRRLPLYECRLDDGAVKYVIPLYGAGLWGPIWGYVSVDANGSTIYGAYFAHQGETPGLGAEIEKPSFGDEFKGLNLFVDGDFKPVSVVKAGNRPVDGSEYVDGISGGTITSKGVDDMLHNCLEPYKLFLQSLQK